MAFGFFDEERIYGTAVIEIEDGVATILSLSYDKSLEPGVCEEVITNALLNTKGKPEIDRIVFVAEGTADELSQYDYIMMNLDYFPRQGEVNYYSSTLEKIAKRQQKNLLYAEKKMKDKTFVCADELTSVQLNYYNAQHPENPYIKEEQDSRVCMFYLKDNYPVAGIFVKENEQGNAVLTWMGYDAEVSPLARLFLIYSLVVRALKVYSKDKKVIVCPFNNEVAGIMSQFGFQTEEDGLFEAHVSTRYL